MKTISSWVPAEIAERLANKIERPERDPDIAYDRHVQEQIDAEATSRPLDPMTAWPFPSVPL